MDRTRIQEIPNPDPFIKADMTKTNPVLRQLIGRDHDHLRLNVLV